MSRVDFIWSDIDSRFRQQLFKIFPNVRVLALEIIEARFAIGAGEGEGAFDDCKVQFIATGSKTKQTCSDR